MDIFATLVPNILPLYVLIFFGWIAGKKLDVNLHSIAIVAIYILAPLVNLGAMMKLDLDPAYAVLPFIVMAGVVVIGLTVNHLAHRRWKDTTANLIAMSSVSGNTGYFGLPVIFAVFDPSNIGFYLLMNLGILFGEVGMGYFFGARSSATVRQAIGKVFRLPVVYAVFAGLGLNLLGVEPPPLLLKYTDYATGAWIFLGMMLIGIALAKQEKITFDLRLIKWLFTTKFLVWPAFAVLFVVLDTLVFHAFDPIVHGMMIVLCSVPLPGNMVAYATMLNLHPDRIAGAVLASTVLALVTVPGMVTLWRYYENFVATAGIATPAF